MAIQGTVRSSQSLCTARPTASDPSRPAADCGREDLDYEYAEENAEATRRGFRRTLSFEEMLSVALRNGLRCFVCRMPFSADDTGVVQGNFDFAHIQADMYGGKADMSNAEVLCKLCHGELTVRVPCH